MLHVRIDDDLKQQATAVLDAIGLSTADAVRMLFKRIVAEQAFPLELKVPNAEPARRWRMRSPRPMRSGSRPPTNCSPRSMPPLSKKPSRKRAPLPRTADYAKPFLKDWDRLSRTGRYDMRRLREAMLLLVGNDGPLPPEWLDHPLRGGWAGHRECHARGDFLLIYHLQDIGSHELVIFTRTGTQAELFNE